MAVSASGVEAADVGDRVDSAVVELRRGDLTDPPQSLHRERMEEGQFAVGLDDEQPVWLGDAAGHLRQEFRAGDPDRDRQTDLVGDPGS